MNDAENVTGRILRYIPPFFRINPGLNPPESESKAMKTRGLTLNVLGYAEENEYVALALEMDLRGFGASLEEAMDDLMRQVVLQLSFALHMHHSLDMAFFPAEPIWFERFAEARQVALRALTPDDGTGFQACGLPVPAPHVIREMEGKFALQNG
ncbi:MAG: hypothetical protein OXU96_07635 [Gammaproteobacteria bacterium]|nr:hypothetical protein [Gammaproteobacteria bacterium]